MKKKLLSVIMAMFMLIQFAPMAFAEAWTDSVEPGIDMEVKKSSSNTFKNGALELTGTSANVDFRATLDMKSVLAKFIEWYDKALSIIDNTVALDPSQNKDDLVAQLNALEIEGQFEVKIWYPNDLEVPAAFITGGDMYGFNNGAKAAFKEVSRTLDTTTDADNNIITIIIKVADEDSKLLAGELYANKDEYLADITLTAENIKIPSVGTYTAKGTLTGYTQTNGAIGSKAVALKVDYTAKQIEGKENPADPNSISATVKLRRASSPSTSGGGSGVTVNKGKLMFNLDGNVTYYENTNDSGIVKVGDLPVPEKEGYTFGGWFYDSEFKNRVDKDIVLTDEIVLYGHWISNTLESEDHFAYVIGYPDGTVKPQSNITREEVSTIFYRLLREDKRISIVSDSNSFTDVEKDRWSNKAISSLANGGYINGYEDGSFRPSMNITRAEFAAMATRYAQLTTVGEHEFTDTVGHWAEEYIDRAANAGWIEGYEDGSFGPEKYITRAEAMTIINRMLTRYVDAEGLHADTKYWSDMNENDWYYYNVLEATNSHNYTRREDGKLETWTQINPNKIWSELDAMEQAE